MKTSEVLQRLYYLDTLLTESKCNENSNLSEAELKTLILKFKKMAEKLTIEEIRKELIKINPKNDYWFMRYHKKICKKIKVKLNLLCVDEAHKIIDDIPVSRGEKIIDIIKKRGIAGKIKQRNDFVWKFFDLLVTNIPIVVREYNGLFEVMSGNHRVLTSILKGDEEIDVLCVCEEAEINKWEKINFCV